MSTSSGRDDNYRGSHSRSSSDLTSSPQFVRASQLLNNDHDATPREEPYLEPASLDKPVLDTYDPEGVDRLQLEESDSSWAWIRADPSDFIDAEGYR